jgi:predicted RND superfamily exporter protein
LGLFGRGILIIVIGIVLAAISAFTLGIGIIIFIPFWLWQIWDARKTAVKQIGTYYWR